MCAPIPCPKQLRSRRAKRDSVLTSLCESRRFNRTQKLWAVSGHILADLCVVQIAVSPMNQRWSRQGFSRPPVFKSFL